MKAKLSIPFITYYIKNSYLTLFLKEDTHVP